MGVVLNWQNFVKEVERISVPRIKASKLGYAYQKVNIGQSSTLQALLR